MMLHDALQTTEEDPEEEEGATMSLAAATGWCTNQTPCAVANWLNSSHLIGPFECDGL